LGWGFGPGEVHDNAISQKGGFLVGTSKFWQRNRDRIRQLSIDYCTSDNLQKSDETVMCGYNLNI
jgi:hypothetical protein